MPHLNVGAQKWTVTEGRLQRQLTGDGCATQRDFSLGREGDGARLHSLVFGPAGWFQNALRLKPEDFAAAAISRPLRI